MNSEEIAAFLGLRCHPAVSKKVVEAALSAWRGLNES